jgi:hypothetical protein
MKIQDDLEAIASLAEKLMNGFHVFSRKEGVKVFIWPIDQRA